MSHFGSRGTVYPSSLPPALSLCLFSLSWLSPHDLKHLQPLFPEGSGIWLCLKYVVSSTSSRSCIWVCEVAEYFKVPLFRYMTLKYNFNSSYEGTFVVYCLFPAGSSDPYTEIYTTMLTSTNILHLPPSWGSAQNPVSLAESTVISLESPPNFIPLLKPNSVFPISPAALVSPFMSPTFHSLWVAQK